MDFKNTRSALAYNVGGLFDMVNGRYVMGMDGQMILNGGLASTVSVGGPANVGKTEQSIFLIANVLSTYCAPSNDVKVLALDTEYSLDLERFERIFSRYENLKDMDVFSTDGPVIINDQSQGWGDEWFELIKTYAAERNKKLAKLIRKTPAIDQIASKDAGTNVALSLPVPTIAFLDSLSELKTSEVQNKTLEKNNVGSSDNNMLYMREANAKAQILTQVGRICRLGGLIWVNTAHYGFKAEMGGQYDPKPVDLTHGRRGLTPKGVTEKYKFVGQITYETHGHGIKSASGEGVEYPAIPSDRENDCKDLTWALIVPSRNKSGNSGGGFKLISSQREGVRMDLTCYDYLKNEGKRFGLTGDKGATNFAFDLLPDVNLTRTTIRGKMRNDERLRRVAELTAQIAYMYRCWDIDDKYIMTMPEIIEKITAKGYTLDEIVNTRGHWCFVEDEKYFKNELSAIDLLRIAVGEFTPKWKK